MEIHYQFEPTDLEALNAFVHRGTLAGYIIKRPFLFIAGLVLFFGALLFGRLAATRGSRRVILGGGIMHREFLFPLIRTEVQQLLNGYVNHPMILEHIDGYIVPPGLGSQAGVLGAIALARELG